MKPLMLTDSPMPRFMIEDAADLAVYFYFGFVGRELPSTDEIAICLGPRRPNHDPGYNWSTFAIDWGQSKNKSLYGRSFTEFCQQYEAIELWFDVEPKAQLQLVWLLDYFRSFPNIADRLKLRLVHVDLAEVRGPLDKWPLPCVDITEREFATASAAWQAYRAPTPEACFGLLRRDLSALPLLRPVLFDLIAELPCASTGLGATEMRMLELIGRGYSLTNALFYLRSLRQTRVFGESELCSLLCGLAFGPAPAITGLDDALRTIDEDNLADRQKACLRSELSLTDFGRAVLAYREDFSHHNPIDRWWGGLTNNNLWRRDQVLIAPTNG